MTERIAVLNASVDRLSKIAFDENKIGPEHAMQIVVSPNDEGKMTSCPAENRVYHRRNPLIVSFAVILSLMSPFLATSWSNWAISFIVMYLYTDFYGGLLHYILDNPNFLTLPLISAGCLEFQWHHNIPFDISSKDFRDVLGDLNMLVLIQFGMGLCLGWMRPELLRFSLCIMSMKVFWGIAGQWAHRSAHTPENKRSYWTRLLQDAHVLLPPKLHQIHHNNHDKSYAVLSGHTGFLHEFLFTSFPIPLLWLIVWSILTLFDVAIYSAIFL